jgi:16S rRNA (uracil1498-N3)-methyltransferase
MAERFYTNCSLQLGLVVLTGPEAHHLATVCRLRPGSPVCLFNGDGRDYRGQVLAVEKRSVTIEIEQVITVERELPFQLEMAAPLPRGDRAQFLVEKLTEIGVARFQPLSTARSVVEPRETKLEKLQRHVIEACKQCGRNVLMEVLSLRDWENYCAGFWEEYWTGFVPPLRVLAHPQPLPAPGFANLPELVPPGCPRILAAVGPEGGFTEDEVRQARGCGWIVVDLGPRILRVETAAITLATLLTAAWTWKAA